MAGLDSYHRPTKAVLEVVFCLGTKDEWRTSFCEVEGACYFVICHPPRDEIEGPYSHQFVYQNGAPCFAC